ncbi:MAG: triose-phosphate isomerase [bacterium]
MRKPIIAGNWKMYKTVAESVDLVSRLKKSLAEVSPSHIDIVVAPVYTSLYAVFQVLKDHWIGLSGQDVFWEEEGAYTGEISPSMLKDAGCQYTIIGHSERRQYFGETDETVNKKLKAALLAGLYPIVCVGESLKERERGETFHIVDNQVRKCFTDISTAQLQKVIIAYEPVWAIGTGKTATPEQANEVHAFIRDLIFRLYGTEAADDMRIQYGGSVKPDNIAGLMEETDIDGALVGGASLKADSFTAIVQGALSATME